MSIYSILGVGASGLRAATVGVNVASQNATNAATPGYSRREVLQSPLPGPPIGGNGVEATGPHRTIDKFVERRLLGATAAKSEADARASALGALDDVFAEDAGLGTALDAFQTAIQRLTASPSDGPTRQAVLSSAASLAEAFNRASTGIATAIGDADQKVADQVASANDLISQIDTLQQQIKRSELGGVEASDLRDQLDQRLRELAQYVPVHATPGAHGGTNVTLDSGLGLVAAEGGHATLGTTRDATTGLLDVTLTTGTLTTDVTSQIGGGSIGGTIAARDGALPAAASALDQLAFDLSSAYNAAHASGVGLDGGTGRQLFATTATSTGAAAALTVSSDVAGQPDRIAAATDPTLVSGDNRNALALAALSTTNVAASGTRTAGDALSDIISSAGQAVQGATRDGEVLGASLSQATALRAGVSGVSSDDEMVSLMQFQRAYQASLKIVEAADQMLQDLIAMKR